MYDELKKLIETPIDEIINSQLVLSLLNVYSKLYLFGKQPRFCEKCLRRYYVEIVNTGYLMLEKMESVKKRTCIPGWTGLLYIPSTARHWNSEAVTDEEAEMLIKGRHLKEESFTVLPASMIKKEVKPKPGKQKKVETTE